MPQIGSTVYTPGGTETHVSDLGAFLGGGGETGTAPWAGMGLLDQLIAKRMAEHEAEWNWRQKSNQLAEKAAERRNRMQSQAEAESTGEGRRGFGPEFDPGAFAARAAGQKAAIAQAQAQYQPAPTEYRSFTGIAAPAFLAERTKGLTGAQREAYLPRASAVQGPTGTEYFEGSRQPFGAFAGESAARRRIDETGGMTGILPEDIGRDRYGRILPRRRA